MTPLILDNPKRDSSDHVHLVDRPGSLRYTAELRFKPDLFNPKPSLQVILCAGWLPALIPIFEGEGSTRDQRGSGGRARVTQKA